MLNNLSDKQFAICATVGVLVSGVGFFSALAFACAVMLQASGVK